jgi:hypothetical protein
MIFSENRFTLFRIMPWRSERDEAASHGRPRCFTNSGKFKKLNVKRATPQNGRAGSGLSDYNQWAYE